MIPPYGLNPCPSDNEFYNLGREIHGHYDHANSFSQIYMGIEKGTF